jgi:hypothetical protein
MLQETGCVRIIWDVHEFGGPLEPRADKPPASVRSWAFAINSTVDSRDIAITLLSFIVVGKLVRVTGLVAIRSRPNVRLATVPELSLAIVDGLPLVPVSAHLLPHADMARVSWLFQRPEHVLNEYEGRVERVDLGQHTGGGAPRPRQPQPGTWVFRFSLPPAPGALKMLAALAD